ncbi:50S ribosomal protein L9 [Candidatus Magnetomonas plexicatena]|uniref:50S ribosomal protein L9 n=1 Tax=Candidatus Magnetomonas plexicatena TaxID=2552947 RepID=UPI001C76E5A3|nr:50S ribosomal protein L9 [Nitrospirales bacterium LBB_01]
MKVILREDVGNVGEMGMIVSVARGYARNYLIPKKFAVEANPKNMKLLQHETRLIAEKVKKLKVSAEDFAKKVAATPVTITAKAGEEGKLFGSVTNKDIADALLAMGFSIDKRKILLDAPIKRTGEHIVKIRIHPEVQADLKVDVVPE